MIPFQWYQLIQGISKGEDSIRIVSFSGDFPSLKIVKDDPDDDKFIECAVALECRYIISGDKHLLSVKDYMGIKLLSPKDFLDTVPGL